MIGWIIAGVVLVVLLCVLLPRVFLIVEAGESVRLTVRILRVVSIRLFPKKKRKPKPSAFTAKKVRKQKEKERKKQEKQKRKQAEKEAKQQAHPSPKPTVSETVDLVLDLLRAFLPRFAKYLRLDISRIRITVASEDAAKTALLYGVTCQSVQYLLVLLDQITNVKSNAKTDVAVQTDFLSEKPSVDIQIAVSLSPLHVLLIAIPTLWRYLTHKSESKSKQSA